MAQVFLWAGSLSAHVTNRVKELKESFTSSHIGPLHFNKHLTSDKQDAASQNASTESQYVKLQPFYVPSSGTTPGQPVPEENFWTLWCKGRLTEADTSTIRLGTTPSGLISARIHHSPIFYRPDALPVVQPTVSKY